MDAAELPTGEVPMPVELGWRAPEGGWRPLDAAALRKEPLADGGLRLVVECAGAAAVSLAFAVPEGFQAFGGGERFDALDLRGQVIRYYLENFGLVNGGTYLPSPWLATSLGFALFLPEEAPTTFHIAAPHDPRRLTVQVEGERATVELHPGDLREQHRRLIARIGPPLTPAPAFFGIWKAGDWRFQDATTVAADEAGFARLGLPLGVMLLDAYWASEVMSFRFDARKHPNAQGMIDRLRAQGTELHLWLCPWVVVGTDSHRMAQEKGYLIADAEGRPLTRRPGANPNVVAALIDYANPSAARWWADGLRGLLAMGVAGFKADFGEQLPEAAVLHSGETGGRAHNAFVRHYLQATIDAFDGRNPAIISRSGAPTIRTQVWTGDQTSDFCPKTGLPAAIRAVQSASLSGWPFIGSDLGGYFGTPTPQVFARWAQFAAFCPLMMLHGLGCREPWEMGAGSAAVFADCARMHLALAPEFEELGRIAAAGGPPLVRMMPLAFPETDWRGRNDWDQQFMLGEHLLVAPVAFYGNTRAVWVPEGDWFDVLAGDWVRGPTLVVQDVPLDRIPLFLRAGGSLMLRPDPQGPTVGLRAARTRPAPSSSWQATLGSGADAAEPPSAPGAELLRRWFGPALAWTAPERAG
jgi:alpha-D-xyloside xylohydrolase